MDNDNFTGRLKRYTKVGSTLTNLGVRALTSKLLGNDSLSPDVITALLGNLKGPVMKVAQFMATVPGAFPLEYAEKLSSLQSDAPPMGPFFTKRRMRMALGVDWQSHFSSFDEKPFAAASLGQVHKAVITSGEHVACKLQYPDMRSAIEADVQQLKVFLSLYESTLGAIDTKDIQEEIHEKLLEEVDYKKEAKNADIYKRIFRAHSDYTVPKIYHPLSTDKLLTMEYVQGTSIFDESFSKIEVAKKLFIAWYFPLYHAGVLHGDPHPGNYTLRPDGGMNLLDFGCVRIFPPSFIESVVDLYKAHRDNDMEAAYYAYERWGFKSLSRDVFDVMNRWAKFLFDPLLDDRTRLLQEETEKGWSIASNVHKDLKRLGGIRPPRSFVFMDRAAVGIGSVMMRLNASLNWHQLFESLIEDFSLKKVEEEQKFCLENSS